MASLLTLPEALDSFLAHTLLQPSGCLEWRGPSFTLKGYGEFLGALWLHTGERRTHRQIWAAVNGPIPIGKKVLHTCDNPPCCNLQHLFIGSSKDNTDDMMHKGRNRAFKGEENGSAKLTLVQVIAIRADKTSTHRALAEQHNISPHHIGEIRRGHVWK